MGTFALHNRRQFRRYAIGLAAAALISTQADATPVVGTGVITYYAEGYGVGAGVAFDGVGAGQLLSAGVGHPLATHPAGAIVQSAASLNTYAGFLSVAPPALGAPAVSAITVTNLGATAYTRVSLFPTAMGPDAVPGVATVVTNSSFTQVQNLSGVDNPGFAYTALAARIGIKPLPPFSVSYVALSLTANVAIDNPGVVNDVAFSMAPLVFATDGTIGARDTAIGPFALVVPVGIVGGVEFYDVFGLAVVPGLNVQNGGTLAATLTFTGLVDPAAFEVIEFPPDLLQLLLPPGEALVAAEVATVPEPATLALLGAALLMLRWRVGRRARFKANYSGTRTDIADSRCSLATRL